MSDTATFTETGSIMDNTDNICTLQRRIFLLYSIYKQPQTGPERARASSAILLYILYLCTFQVTETTTHERMTIHLLTLSKHNQVMIVNPRNHDILLNEGIHTL